MAKIDGINKVKPEHDKNYIINGDMNIAQRGTSFAAIANAAYSLDRWTYINTGTAVHTITQDTDVPTLAQAGYLFQNSLRANLTTADTSIAAGDAYAVQQFIEGFNWANLAQKSFTLSFWVKATLTGTYCISFRNTGQDKSYVAEYTINTTATWEYKTVTVSASPSAGTWNYTNGIGLRVTWTLAAGSTFQTTAGTWNGATTFLGTSNQVNGVNTGATDFRITGVVLNESVTAAPFSLMGIGFEAELAHCQRYYEKTFDLGVAPVQNAGTVGSLCASGAVTNQTFTVDWLFKTSKRSSPTITTFSTNAASANWSTNTTTPTAASTATGTNSTCIQGTTSVTAGNAYNIQATADAEL